MFQIAVTHFPNFQNRYFSGRSVVTQGVSNSDTYAMFSIIQKQLFEDVLQNRCSLKFRKFQRKTSVLESLFNNIADL